jgi:hypothetical protein
MADELPATFPPMAATFRKPYMEFEFEGTMYRLEDLKGGHNGRVAGACVSSRPQFDPAKGRWVVVLENNLINIDLAEHPSAAEAFPDEKAFLRETRIVSNPRSSKRSLGYLLSATTNPNETPRFPADCEFSMYIRISAPGKGTLINTAPFALRANGLEAWPPPVGTVYTHDDTIELYPEWVPFGDRFLKPSARIPPGDETIITESFIVEGQGVEVPGVLTRLINRLS